VVFFVGSSGVFMPHPLTRGPGGKLARFDLTVGQCADGKVKPGNSFGGDAAVSCSRSQDFEVSASTDPPGGRERLGYLRTDDLGAFGDDECILAFEAFVGSDIDHSDLDFTSIIPSRAAWDAGDRTILCALWQYDGDPMVGSARGTDR
jgi:hypothetical protein